MLIEKDSTAIKMKSCLSVFAIKKLFQNHSKCIFLTS